MSDDPPTVDEARTTAYEMAFKRFDPVENVAGNQWHELTTRQQRRVIADRLSAWKQGVVFRTVVASVLRSMANQLAESRGNGESTTQTIVNQFEITLYVEQRGASSPNETAALSSSGLPDASVSPR